MRLLKASRLPALGLAVLLSACQVGSQVGPSRLLTDAGDARSSSTTASTAGAASGVETAGVTASNTNNATLPQLTYTVQRGTLRSTLAMSGRVVPTKTAQLALRGAGTVTGVHVRPGQAVKEGAPLVEFALDYESLQNARTQATLAELAYETEQAKLDQLKAGADKAPLEQLNAQIARDRADLQKLELDQANISDVSARADQSKAVAREAADRKVTLAQIALQSANDALADARGAVQRAQDNQALAQDRAKADQEQSEADANAAVQAAEAQARSAQRRAQEAQTALANAQLLWNTTKSQQDIAALQLRVSKDQQDVQDTAALVKNAQTGAEAASASTQAAGARRSLQVDQLALDQANNNLGAAKLVDQAEIQKSSLALDQAKDDLAQAQVNLQRAKDRVARVSRDPGTPKATSESSDPDALQAKVRDAEHRVQAEQINVQEAQAARAALDVGDPRGQFATLSIDAAKAQLSADQAKVAQLQTGTSGDEVRRQETRVDLLKDQASQAAAAAQPVVILKAPFDATVTDLGVQEGQTITPQVGTVAVDQGGTTAAGATAGQTSDGRQVAVRLAGSGTTAIVANVSETDVNQLVAGQSVSLSFPGLGGQNASGSIAEIAAAPTVGQGNSINYPVRVEVPDAPQQLKVGMTVQLSADIEEARDVLLVPLDAVRNVSGHTLVSRVGNDGVVADVPIALGHTSGLTAEVTSGVNEGDVVALYTPVTASSAR